MKSNIGILFGLMLFIMTGCYKDKGNYDYHKINDLSVSFLPDNAVDGIYTIKQPVDDTLYFSLTPVIVQSLGLDEKNLVYCWNNLSAKVKDSVFTKEFTFKFPPKKSTRYHYLFHVKDVTTDIEYFRDVKLKTMVPYTNSWLVLHGNADDRKIGAIERSANGDIEFTEDIYKEMRGIRRFKNATSLIYAPDGGGFNPVTPERLMLIGADSLFYLFPFDCQVKAKYETMMPVTPQKERPRLSYGVVSDISTLMGLVDQQGKYYHGGAYGFFYNTKMNEGLENYQVDKVFIASGNPRNATLWDAVHHKFMYYPGTNQYRMYESTRQDESELSAVLTAFPEDVFEPEELTHKKVLWVGRGMKEMANNGASVVLKDMENGNYFIYSIGYGEEENGGKSSSEKESSFVKIVRDTLENVNFNENSLFAVSEAFNDQIFYTLGNNVYLYNTVNGEEVFLYTVGQGVQITKFAFRITNVLTTLGPDGNGGQRILGIAVKTNGGKGELHEIFLNVAGDVIETKVHTGFGEIVDFCFTSVTRNLNL
ncbi:MAG: PKD-like family lipoprotein [Odoribacter sp.]